MARTNQERYDQALAYVKTIDATLCTDVDAQAGANSETVGGELSLEGKGYWYHGSSRNMALRALLLCHIAYFRPPHGAKLLATNEEIEQMKRDNHGLSKDAIDERIREFLIDNGASLEDLVDAAERVNDLSGNVDYLKRTRSDTHVGSAPICYDGVLNWLFTAGFVSKKYLAKEATDMHATRSNLYIGQGTPVTRTNWSRIPRGYIWNIQRKNDPSTCHWGISVGGGKSLACNNAGGSPSQGILEMTPPATGGGMSYGKFKMEDLCLVLNSDLKYGHRGGATAPASEDANITVRQIDPQSAGCYR